MESHGWTRWIVWKLACYERGFPQACAGHWLTPGNVLNQLKYRYEREINQAHFPAVRRILERDRAAG